MHVYFLDLMHKLDELAIIMILLVSWVGMCVISFASRYMKGDLKYRSFLNQLILLVCSVFVMVSSDHLGVLFIALCLSNFFLTRLMIHKSAWPAARASGMIAAKNYILSALFLASAFGIFYVATGQTSINSIVHQNNQPILILIALLFLFLAAMAQSGIWPFHKWLLSSLNSPTPVSAIMHAGLINGGGFLIVRFAPLYLEYPKLMTLMFFTGLVTALSGTLWKLMQSDVKRMLACSTMAQMGFMLVQCGLGLFPLALAHLVWHGMFKAYLFLASGGAGQEKRLNPDYPPTGLTFISALACGLVFSCMFAYASKKSWLSGDSTLLLMCVTFLSGTQLALSILRIFTLRRFLVAFVASVVSGFLYGVSVLFIVWVIAPMDLMHPQPLNVFHIAGIAMATLTWLSVLFIRVPLKNMNHWGFLLKGYVKALNASQPHPDTVTAHRNHYQY